MRRGRGLAVAAVTTLLAGCSGVAGTALPAVTVTVQTTVPTPAASPAPVPPPATTPPPTTPSTPTTPPVPTSSSVVPPPASTATSTSSAAAKPGTFTLALAGDVNFAERTEARLADPATAFGVAKAELEQADLTMLNLETAITEGGEKQPKSFTFRAPASALVAVEQAGVDVISLANNHAADYGASGLADTLAAADGIEAAVVGIGQNAAAAYAPYRTTVNGVAVAIFAATAVHDQTLANFTAGPTEPGVASAFAPELVDGVAAAKATGDVVIVYLHWGTEYVSCPDGDQVALANALSAAGASAVVGTHAHVLQGAGWRPDGVYVAYGLSNYLWWRSFGNEQDDNGVLTLTFTGASVTAAAFSPAHLDEAGVPVPATAETHDRIMEQWERNRVCADLAAAPPR